GRLIVGGSGLMDLGGGGAQQGANLGLESCFIEQALRQGGAAVGENPPPVVLQRCQCRSHLRVRLQVEPRSQQALLFFLCSRQVVLLQGVVQRFRGNLPEISVLTDETAPECVF